MNKARHRFPAICAVLLATISLGVPTHPLAAAPGDSLVARWKDNKTAAFLLMFDDGCASHYQIVIPELVKRDMIATFYVNPGHSNWTSARARWETNIPTTTRMVYGNHSWSHRGAATLEEVETEIRLCQEAINAIYSPDGTPRLTSWGQPGVDKWVYGAPLQALLNKYNLISRPPFDAAHGPVYGINTGAAILALADDAIAKASMQYVIVHGVERRAAQGDPDWGWQDFWAFNRDQFRVTLDGLWERAARGDLWITDHISQHKYEAARNNNPSIQLVGATSQRIELRIAGTLDPQLYDLPLTLRTEVPADWPGVVVTQGTRTATVAVVNGIAQYDALADNTLVVLARTALPVASLTTLAPAALEHVPSSATFQIHLPGATGGSVNYSVSTSAPALASSANRYTLPASPATIPAGSSSTMFSLAPIPNDTFEGTQFVTLTLQPGEGYLVADSAAKATVVVRDHPIHDWKFVQFGLTANQPAQAGDSAVRNSAQMTNLMAYALGIKPTAARFADWPVSHARTYDSTEHLFLRFTRNPAATDIVYSVEVSNDLADADAWTPVAISTDGATTTGPGFVSETGTATLRTVEARDPDPVGAHPRRFMRLALSR